MATDGDPKGLYRKFEVRRTDGSSEPGGKHEHCRYFVLDLAHDPHAGAAIEAYADSCEGEHPELARRSRALIADPFPSMGDARRPFI